MIKKIFLFSVVISQLAISCSSDNDEPVNDTNAQITELLQQPYSALTPDQQKVKLENEANGMLTQMESAKSSTALDAFKNLESIFSINLPNIQFGKKTAKTVQEVLNVSNAYGIYTWNPQTGEWTKTASTSKLEFLFPANEKATTNNASLTASSVASTVKIVVNDETGEEMYLPSSVTASLTIDGNTVGKYDALAVYVNGKPEPTEVSYKLTLNEFVFENSAKRTSPVSVTSSFSKNGKNIISFNIGSTADIDNLMQGNTLAKYFGTANCLITLMDNFVLVADMNAEGFAIADEELNKIPAPNYSSTAEVNAYNKKISEGLVNAFNNNVKMALVSKKDGTKLADVVKRSIKADTNGYGQDQYDDLLFLRFNDKTEVAMGVYFSTGFDDFETKFENFLKSL
jgi:hypothetical protein